MKNVLLCWNPLKKLPKKSPKTFINKKMASNFLLTTFLKFVNRSELSKRFCVVDTLMNFLKFTVFVLFSTFLKV